MFVHVGAEMLSTNTVMFLVTFSIMHIDLYLWGFRCCVHNLTMERHSSSIQCFRPMFGIGAHIETRVIEYLIPIKKTVEGSTCLATSRHISD